jgi:hypothetical protein
LTNKQIQRLALWLQVGGFVPALGIVLFWHPAWAVTFVLCFMVHLVGDVLFYLANRD